MKEAASSFLAAFGILALLAIAGFNPLQYAPGVQQADQHRADAQRMHESAQAH